jgi:hypothetical protein
VARAGAPGAYSQPLESALRLFGGFDFSTGAGRPAPEGPGAAGLPRLPHRPIASRDNSRPAPLSARRFGSFEGHTALEQPRGEDEGARLMLCPCCQAENRGSQTTSISVRAKRGERRTAQGASGFLVRSPPEPAREPWRDPRAAIARRLGSQRDRVGLASPSACARYACQRARSFRVR